MKLGAQSAAGLPNNRMKFRIKLMRNIPRRHHHSSYQKHDFIQINFQDEIRKCGIHWKIYWGSKEDSQKQYRKITPFDYVNYGFKTVTLGLFQISEGSRAITRLITAVSCIFSVNLVQQGLIKKEGNRWPSLHLFLAFTSQSHRKDMEQQWAVRIAVGMLFCTPVFKLRALW